MAEPIRLPFGLGSDTGRHGPDAGPRHWNAFVETVDDGKHPTPIHADDGFDLFSTITDGGATRGMIVMGSYLYVVSGTLLAKVDISGTATTIGGIPGTSKVSMAHNDKTGSRQLVIAVDGNKYLVEGDVLSDITDTDLPAANSVTFLNQRIIYGIADGRFFWSDLDNASSISSLDFATAEGNPDGLVAVFAHLQEVRVFGGTTIEVWRDTGNSSAPFRRNEGGVIPKGCIGKSTIAALDKDLFWVGDDGSVYMAQGYAFQRISNHGVEQDIAATTDKSTIEAMAYIKDGHAWYVLSADDWTWKFNRTLTEKAGRPIWTEKFSYGLNRWRASHAVDFGGKIIVGDYSTNKLYQLSRTAYDEAGTNLVWRIRSAPVHAYPNRMSHYRIHADFVLGVGVAGSPDTYTKVLLHCDGNDSGTTFTDSSLFAHMFTAAGNAQIDTAQAKFGGASALFDGTGDSVNADGHADFAFGTGDFTIDFWVRLAATGVQYVLYDSRGIGENGTQPLVFKNASDVLIYQHDALARITGTTALTADTWHHVALARSGTSTKLFLNGTQEGSTYTDSNNYVVGASRPILGISGSTGTTSALNGWLDEVRVSKGTARWTSNFASPTSAYSDPVSVHATEPEVGLRWSDDGGYSWSNQLSRDLGAVGVRHIPVTWEGLGDTGHTGRIYELEISSPVVRTLMYAAIESDPIGT